MTSTGRSLLRALPALAILLPILGIVPGGAPSTRGRAYAPARARQVHRQMQAAAPYARRYRIPLRLTMSILHHAGRHGVPRAYAFRLVRTESNFDSLALHSRTKACGLTQLLPATARSWRPRQPLSHVCWRVDVNLDAGFSYWAALHRKYRDWTVATTAYYLGPGTVDTVRPAIYDTISYTNRIVVM